jgi:hypothetical protein
MSDKPVSKKEYERISHLYLEDMNISYEELATIINKEFHRSKRVRNAGDMQTAVENVLTIQRLLGELVEEGKVSVRYDDKDGVARYSLDEA